MLEYQETSEELLKKKLLQKLASLIFIYRKKHKMSLKNLSDKTSSNIKFLNNLERGKHDTLITNYLKVAKALQIPSSEIKQLIDEYFMETI